MKKINEYNFLYNSWQCCADGIADYLTLRKLFLPEFIVKSALVHKLGVTSAFDNLTLIHDVNLVALHNRAQTVSDDDCCNSVSGFIDSVFYRTFGNAVEVACCLVHNQQLCVVGKCRSNLQLHLHTLGELAAFLLHRQLETVEIICICLIIPFFIYTPENLPHLICIENIVKGQFIKNYRYTLFYFSFIFFSPY